MKKNKNGKKDYRVKQIIDDLEEEEFPYIDDVYSEEDEVVKKLDRLLGTTEEERSGRNIIVKCVDRSKEVVDEMYMKMPFCCEWRMVVLDSRANKKDKYDIFFVKQSTEVHSDIKSSISAARLSFTDKRYDDCAEQLKHALSNACFPDNELYAWLGCTYTNMAMACKDEGECLRKTNMANNCFRLYNHLSGLTGERANYVDYAGYEEIVGKYFEELDEREKAKEEAKKKTKRDGKME